MTSSDSYTDDRLVREIGLEARVAAIAWPHIDALGYQLVRVKISGQNGQTVQIMAEKPGGEMDVSDCELVSRTLSLVFDAEDPISGAYHLEVSSPGLDRPLVRKSDFAAATGLLIKLELSQSLADKRRFRGTILSTDEEGFDLRRDQVSYGEAPEVRIEFTQLVAAKVILTDEVVRQALEKDKLARKQAEAANRNDIDAS